MKKLVGFIFLIICIQLNFLVGCSNNNDVENDTAFVLDYDSQRKSELTSTVKIELEDIPNDYNLDNAKDDGCLVLEKMIITSGESLWDVFLEDVNNGDSAEIRIAKYYEMPENVSKEYKIEIKDKYPILYLFDLSYDGESFQMRYLEGETEYSYDYPYLIERSGTMNNAAKSDHFFALVNDDKLTYHDITWSQLSGNLNDWVDFVYVWIETKDIVK